MTERDEPLVVLTEPSPLQLAEDADCPKCKAGPERRIPASGFREFPIICGKCGHVLVTGVVDGHR